MTNRVKVKIIKTCVLGNAGDYINLLKSQLPNFEGFYEELEEESNTIKTKNTPKRKKIKNNS